jgi:hypothetical protein
MTDASFDVVVALSVEASDEPITLDSLRQPAWRDALRRVTLRQLRVVQRESERLPTGDEARALLNRAFGSHPMVNIGGRSVGGKIDRSQPPEAMAVVVAEVLVQQDLAPIEGDEYPRWVDGPLAEPRLVHARPWPHESGSDEERLVADDLLRALVADLPSDLSIPVD